MLTSHVISHTVLENITTFIIVHLVSPNTAVLIQPKAQIFPISSLFYNAASKHIKHNHVTVYRAGAYAPCTVSFRELSCHYFTKHLHSVPFIALGLASASSFPL
jgi:hypothetical protein